MSLKATQHVPVLLKALLDLLHPQPNEHYVDATLGGAGMAEAILQATRPEGKLIGIEQDSAALAKARKRLELFGSRFIPRSGNFRALDTLIEGALPHIDGIYFDLGISSDQLADTSRGISFQNPDAPLDMRMDRREGAFTAADLLKSSAEEDLIAVFKNYGEEPKAIAIAGQIVARRKEAELKTIADLLDVIKTVYPKTYYRRHPATKVFQALRIAVNDELEVLTEALPKAFEQLFFGGRLAVISFHSLEDRIVKHYFKKLVRENNATLLTKKAVQPSRQEVLTNPRSRSAKLRVITKTKKEKQT